MVILLWSKSDSDYHLVPTPAQDAISYKKELLTDNLTFLKDGTMIPDPVHKEFGPPSPELEAAWTELNPAFACQKTR
ncbi:hypothetical protein SI65_06924 [Aspergillus cristatus]|uniref:Uncharacterized protein n=1 Tax=Aspergillus cristatus TaxID=573508 RepID=A0A1E3B8J8_ASPCR|nr:hypothetical protein SI65_06924 [Aspergillus cristatus]